MQNIIGQSVRSINGLTHHLLTTYYNAFNIGLYRLRRQAYYINNNENIAYTHVLHNDKNVS